MCFFRISYKESEKCGVVFSLLYSDAPTPTKTQLPSNNTLVNKIHLYRYVL